jgi:hypothetical protein
VNVAHLGLDHHHRIKSEIPMSVEPETQTPLSEQEIAFHWKRSDSDSQNAHDYGRAAGQALLLINGGAATAILAYLSAESKAGVLPTAKGLPNLMGAVAVSLILYAAGVAFGAGMIWCAARAIHNYALHHEAKAAGRRQKDAEYWVEATRWDRRNQEYFAVSVGLFCLASSWVALVLGDFLK